MAPAAGFGPAFAGQQPAAFTEMARRKYFRVIGGARRNRTEDILLATQVLCQARASGFDPILVIEFRKWLRADIVDTWTRGGARLRRVAPWRSR
jgi:hypothetical protein